MNLDDLVGLAFQRFLVTVFQDDGQVVGLRVYPRRLHDRPRGLTMSGQAHLLVIDDNDDLATVIQLDRSGFRMLFGHEIPPLRARRPSTDRLGVVGDSPSYVGE